MSPLIFDLSKVAPALQAQVLLTPKYREWFTRKPVQMLGLDTNAKVIKGNKLGIKTAILYLAPSDISGEQMCPMAKTAGCEAACLFTSGRGVMAPVMISRLWRTLFFQQYQDEALAMIKREIERYYARSQREGWDLVVRLNGTSDIRWERYGLIQSLPLVQFYDYTKLSNRRGVPANYDLTFSYSGVPAYRKQVDTAVSKGMRMAVVFRNRAGAVDAMSNGFEGIPAVDGDDTDIRHLDPVGHVVALYAKGRAKVDTTGFVVG